MAASEARKSHVHDPRSSRVMGSRLGATGRSAFFSTDAFGACIAPTVFLRWTVGEEGYNTQNYVGEGNIYI